MTALDRTDTIFFDKAGLDLTHGSRGSPPNALAHADDGELFLEYSQSEALSWDDGRLKSASFDTSQGFRPARRGRARCKAMPMPPTCPSRRCAAPPRRSKAVQAGYGGTRRLPARLAPTASFISTKIRWGWSRSRPR